MKELPTAEARYSDWTTFALKWAEPNLAILMFESALLASPKAKGALGLLLKRELQRG